MLVLSRTSQHASRIRVSVYFVTAHSCLFNLKISAHSCFSFNIYLFKNSTTYSNFNYFFFCLKTDVDPVSDSAYLE